MSRHRLVCAVPLPQTAAPPLFPSFSARRGRQVSAAALFILEGKPRHQTAPADWEHWLHPTPHQRTAATQALSQMSTNASSYPAAVHWTRRLNSRGSKSLSTAFMTWDFNKVSEWLSSAFIHFRKVSQALPDKKLQGSVLKTIFFSSSFEGCARQGFSHHSSSSHRACPDRTPATGPLGPSTFQEVICLDLNR